ncbi:MAG TPA: GspH/FimT family pseudopilin [Burkholderiales bacterium]|nr:GspH/FimT family pseudopilin [Burkholderiales bacterium]
MRAPRFFSPAPRACGGWSLAELALVIVILALLGSLAILRFRPLDVPALQQADRLRSDLRHAQMLALTWGQPLRLSVAAGGYSFACVSAGAAPCDASPVIDPASGQPFSVSLESGLGLSGPGFTLDFDALGRPKNGASLIAASATLTVTGGEAPRNVVVSPVTGFALVQ